MDFLKAAWFDKFVELMGNFAQIRAVAALRDGFIMTTPFTICGSLFLLIANLPIPGYTEMMAGFFGESWTAPLYSVAGASFGILALIVVMGVAYKYAEAEGADAIMTAVLALATFFILLPPGVETEAGLVTNAVPKSWIGSNGVITAILVALVTAKTCVFCEKRHIGIRMPEAVPSGVARAFEALTPGFILFSGAAVIYGLCFFVGATSLPELIFRIIQTPLQSLSDTLVGGVVIAGLMSTLFWAGIHGPNVVGGVVNPILLANSLDNQALLDAGFSLLGNPDAKIITAQVGGVFIQSGGCGMTLGLVIAALIYARSKQMRSLSKMCLVPGIFNINEPIIFGLPIVFNPYLIVPFILVPVLAMIITYTSIVIGFMPPFGAVQVPWTTPQILAGLLLNGWQGAVVQLIILVMSVLVYMPFIIAQDKAMRREEEAEGKEDL